MLPSTKVKSPPPAGIRGTFMKREGWWRAFPHRKWALSLSVSPRFINPFFVVALLTPREKTTCPAKTYLDDVLISFTAVCRSFRETARDHLFLPRRVKETCRRQFETRRWYHKGERDKLLCPFLASWPGAVKRLSLPNFLSRGKNLDVWRGWARYRREFEFSRFVWPPRGNQVFPLCMAVPFNEPLLVTLLCLTSSLFFLSFSLFSPPPLPPENYTVLGPSFSTLFEHIPLTTPSEMKPPLKKSANFILGGNTYTLYKTGG